MMNIPESLTRANKKIKELKWKKMAKSIERINFSLETAMKTVRGRKWRANGEKFIIGK